MKDKELELISKRRFTLRRKLLAISGTIAVATAIAIVITFAFSVMAEVLFVITVAGTFTIAGLVTFAVACAEIDVFTDFLIKIFDYIQNRKVKELKVVIPSHYKLLKISEILFSAKTQKEVFEMIMADWDDEIHTALEKNKDTNLFMINLRNFYSFFASMWLKSPIGDLIEFIGKFAK